MYLHALFSNLRIQDAVDILFLAIVAYHLILWFQGTKALRALIGLVLLGLIFTAAKAWGMFLTTWVFQALWQALIILIIVVFQSEIRQVLERVNSLAALGLRRRTADSDWITETAAAVFSLARSRIGVLLVIQREDPVDEWITGCVPLDVAPSQESLAMVFNKESPMHDGAVVLKNGRITDVACYLPLSPENSLPKEWGTRHRAALGLSERCDAWVIVASEQRGTVSVSREGRIGVVDSEQDLRGLLQEALWPFRLSRKTWGQRISSLVTVRWPLKAGTLATVCFVWLLLAGQQDFKISMSVPLQVRNLPASLQIIDPVNPEVRIAVRGLRKEASTLNERNVKASVDLSRARTGQYTVTITRDQIRLLNERLRLIEVEPSRMSFQIRKRGETGAEPGGTHQ
jgi:uncharacterized protein (TIGR00159 family)